MGNVSLSRNSSLRESGLAMRKILVCSAIGLVAAASHAQAAVPAGLICDPAVLKAAAIPAPVDCFREEVFVVDGGAMVDGKPIVSCNDMAKPKNCSFDSGLAIAHMLEVLKGKNVSLPTWDQVVVFG